MDFFFGQVFTLLTTPPGNLVYQIILAFSVFGALQMFARHWQNAQNRLARRMAAGLACLLILQLLVFIAAGLGWQSLLDAHKILPVMASGTSLLAILWLAWLWAFPEPVQPVDFSLGLLSLLILTLTVLGIVWWSGQSPLLPFNASLADRVASLASMGLCLVGAALLVGRRPALWGYGLITLLVLCLGYLAHWFFLAEDSDYAGIVRLAELAVYPLLLALPQRSQSLESDVRQASPPAISKETQGRKDSDHKVLQVYLSLATESDPKKFYQGVSQAFAQLMVADMCLLALPPDADNQIVMPIGYDLIMTRSIEGFSVNTHQVPLLANVLRRGRNLRLPASSNSTDLASLANALGVKQAGHLLAVAVTPKGGSPLLSIVLLSPYSNRIWSAEDQQYLIDACVPMAAILQRVFNEAQKQQELEKAQSYAESAQALVEQAQKERAAAGLRIEQLKTQLEEERTRVSNLGELVAIMEARVAQTNAKASQSPASDLLAPRLQGELDQALAEIVRLKGEQMAGDQRYGASNSPTAGESQAEARLEELATIIQELRRPIESINGHTDVLLGESVGLLGPRQRKYLDRIKAAIERITGLLDEMTDISAQDNGSKAFNPTYVDLNTVIDEALATLITRLSERNIGLRVDLPDVLPQLYADRGAVLQILTILLHHAGTVTPVDGEIWLRARMEVKENETGYVLLQVTDSGGGIPAEELSRLFARPLQDEEAMTRTVEEPYRDLVIVKSLVEAHNGRIWVDNTIGQGATFSVLLPLPDDRALQSPGAGLSI